MRRIGACLVDYAIVIIYLGLLTLLSFLLQRAGLVFPQVSEGMERQVAQLVVLIFLGLPVTLWLSWWEASPRGASPGKLLFRLRVKSIHDQGLSFNQSLIRAVLKVMIPWELAHTALWRIWLSPSSVMDGLSATFLILSNLIVLIYILSLFFGSGRTPYDYLAGAVVQHA